MSINTGAPTPLTAGQTVRVPLPQGVWSQCVIQNASAFAVSVTIGASTGPTWLAAWTSNVFEIPATNDPIVLVCSQPPAGQAATGQALIDFYDPSETPAGTYPATLFGSALLSTTPLVSLASGVGSALGLTKIVPIVASYRSLIITSIAQSATLGSGTITVTGNQSGFVYLNTGVQTNNNFANTQSKQVCRVDPALDTSVTVAWSSLPATSTGYIEAEQDTALVWVDVNPDNGFGGLPITTEAGIGIPVIDLVVGTGPSAVMFPPSVALVGGGLKLTGTFSDGAGHNILGAPPLNQAYRLHKFGIGQVTPAAGVIALIGGQSSGAQYMLGSPNNTIDGAGQLVTEGLFVQLVGNGASLYEYTLTYDLLSEVVTVH